MSFDPNDPGQAYYDQLSLIADLKKQKTERENQIASLSSQLAAANSTYASLDIQLDTANGALLAIINAP